MAQFHALTGRRRRSEPKPAESAPEVGTDRQDDEAPDRDEGPGLLASPVFWIGGLLSILAWILIAALFGLF